MLPAGDGMGIKMIGQDCAAHQRALAPDWSIARQGLLDVDALPLRKY